MPVLDRILGPLARAVLTSMGRRKLAQIDGRLTLPGLTSPVEILRDRWGVPHIYAQTAHDLFFAQGVVHAQDRLWQMELNRRTALGQLSELFGEIALDTDRTARAFGFNRLGQTDWKNASDELRAAISAYCEGVNAFLASPAVKLPLEFTLLRHRPEPWQPEDVMAFARVMIWQLSHAWYGEILRAQIAEAVGEARAAELEIHYPATNPITLPQGIEFHRLESHAATPSVADPLLQRGQGSNAWVVSGRKSDTGKPYLCNDMHLLLGLPSLWYEVHLVGAGFEVTGVSLPGVPMVLVGHNARIAWGMTLAFTDCEDLYVEQLDAQAPHRYRFQDQWLEAEVIPEPIRVKGRAEPSVPTDGIRRAAPGGAATDPHIEEVLVTRHGPIISDVVGYGGQRVAVQSMALRPSTAIQGWLALNQAGNWDEFLSAMRLIEAPQLNVAYADVEGNIGYWVTGRTPIRAKGDGRVPVPGWTGEYEWVGEVPFMEMPHALNPEKGYLVTCNHRIVPDDYRYFLGDVWMNGYRARRIDQVLSGKDRLSSADFRALHVDFTCLPGMEFVAKLAGLASDDPDVRLALERLRDWDGVLSTESVGGALYEVTRYHVVRNLLEPALGPELSLRLMGQGFHPILLPSHEFYGHDTVAMLRLLDHPDSWWVEQAGGRQPLLVKSLQQGVAWLRDNLGPQPESWRWGRIHRAIFAHAMGMQKPLDQVFNRGPFPIGGDTDTPCQTAILPQDPYDNKAWAPSFRQIVDLGDLSRSLAMFPPGQSGQLGSPHYDDLIQPWLKGEYHPMLWTREQVEREAEGRLTLSS